MATQSGKKSRSSSAKSGGNKHASSRGKSASGSSASSGAARRSSSAQRSKSSAAGKRNPDRSSSSSGSSSSARRQSAGGGGKSKAGLIGRAAGGVKGAGSRAVESVKQHPVAASVVGAGLATGIAYLATRAVRGSTQRQPGQSDAQQPQDQMEPDAQGSAQAQGEEGDEQEEEGQGESDEEDAPDDDESESGGRFSNSRNSQAGRMTGEDEAQDEDEDDSSPLARFGEKLRRGASAVGSSAEHGYEIGKQKVGEFWEQHPLIVGAGILAVGVAVGMLLPSTKAEKELAGGPAEKLTKRLRSAGRELLDQEKEIAGKVVSETGDAVREVADREGLTPDKLAKKVKRIAGRVKDAVANAIEE